MIDWAAMTTDQVMAVFGALRSLHADITAQVTDDLRTGESHRLMDAGFMINIELDMANTDLKRRADYFAALLASQKGGKR